MDFDAYLARLKAANPLLEQADTMTLTIPAFFKTLRHAFKAGEECGRETRKAAEDFGNVSDPFGGLFNGLFRK